MGQITKRIDAITAIPETFRKEIVPAPPSVKIELTSKCNLACSFCAHQQGGKKHGDMDWKFYTRIVKEMVAAGVKELGMFYIGESFLYQKLPDAIKFAKDEGMPYVFLTCNGTATTAKRLEECMKAGLDSLKTSFNYADAEQFTEIANTPPPVWGRILDHVKNAYEVRQQGGYKTKLYASSIRYNGEQFDKMSKLVDTIRPYVDEHYWLPLLSFGDQARETENSMGLKPTVGNPGRYDCMRAPLPCWAVFKEGHITHDGKLSACCFDSSNKWIMADLKKVDFMTGWNSKAFQKLRKAHLKGDVHKTPCEQCIYGGKNE